MTYMETSYLKCGVGLIGTVFALVVFLLTTSLLGVVIQRWNARSCVRAGAPFERSVFLAFRYLGMAIYLGSSIPAVVRAVLAGDNVELWMSKILGTCGLFTCGWVILLFVFELYDTVTRWFSVNEAVGIDQQGTHGVSMSVVVLNSGLFIGASYLAGQFIHEAIRVSFPGF